MKAKKQVLPIILTLLILLTLTLYLVLSMGNFSFSSKDVVEKYYRDTLIEAKGFHFYCATSSDGGVINDVKGAKRYAFLWKERAPKKQYLALEDDIAGTLCSFEGKDTTHYFILWRVTAQEAGVDYYAYRTDTISIDGVSVALEKYSYFTDSNGWSELLIGGKQITLLDMDQLSSVPAQ